MVDVKYVNKYQVIMFGGATFHFDYFELVEGYCKTVNLFYNRNFIGALVLDKSVEFIRIMGEI